MASEFITTTIERKLVPVIRHSRKNSDFSFVLDAFDHLIFSFDQNQYTLVPRWINSLNLLLNFYRL